ncbi:N-acetyltransferase [Candidatus Nucleicultrix amoebiphila]|jgi:hypothetical protein|uniref:N-acetyltransferase domain-containing protein n=1 Tax=Candidatus Nucleicultrix amoebiphila FS5 TaxID=1414854 RepID=A0A1W6N2T3_9PROT|nr:hypothetical protein [Candidatus Nucleicultrix amoebiphila]ARN84157.1 hypothetical protein GQ61_01030 [Candidatus Nucleicultrix amoebiphila FS5]
MLFRENFLKSVLIVLTISTFCLTNGSWATTDDLKEESSSLKTQKFQDRFNPLPQNFVLEDHLKATKFNQLLIAMGEPTNDSIKLCAEKLKDVPGYSLITTQKVTASLKGGETRDLILLHSFLEVSMPKGLKEPSHLYGVLKVYSPQVFEEKSEDDLKNPINFENASGYLIYRVCAQNPEAIVEHINTTEKGRGLGKFILNAFLTFIREHTTSVEKIGADCRGTISFNLFESFGFKKTTDHPSISGLHINHLLTLPRKSMEKDDLNTNADALKVSENKVDSAIQ